MTAPYAVDTEADTDVSLTAPLRHLCPFVDETDEGTVTISWRCEGGTIELHSLRAYLDGWAHIEVSHEDLVDQVIRDLNFLHSGVKCLHVSATFTTAGMTVTVESACSTSPTRPAAHATQ